VPPPPINREPIGSQNIIMKKKDLRFPIFRTHLI